MSPEQKRIAIARACGWRAETYGPSWCESETKMPDYLNDLNAMHEAEIQLKAEDNHAYGCYCSELYEKYGNTVSLTAAQRCEAFLKTIGKWVTE